MDDPTYTDADLETFFQSPDTRHERVGAAAPPARRAARPNDLESFFHSPDGPSGDGAGGGVFVAPPGPAAPPPPTGPEAERRRRVGRALAVVLGVVALGAAAVGAFVAWLSTDLPSLEQIENPRNLLATRVLTSDGVELARYYESENRTWVPLDEMSPYVPAALISTEDHRFYDHWGMDMQSLLAAIVKAPTDGMRGASTITMQLARNLYRDQVGFERTAFRKAKEILTAIRIERTYTKDEIIEAYLNTVPFRYNAFGIEAAAQTYFSKPAADLTAPEAAVLIGMLKANTLYDPVRNPENARGRRNVVLSKMVEAGVLPASEYAEVRDEPIRLTFDVYSHEDNLAPHFAEVLRLWFKEWCDQNGYDPYRDGLVIRTTIDSRMQLMATEAVQEEMADLQEIVNRGWGSASNPFGYWWSRNTAVVNEYVGQTERARLLRQQGLTAEEAVAELRRDAPFMDSLKAERTRVEAGLVAMDPTTGAVKAWVGGTDFIANKYDHGGQARRQPGSTFKLFAYTAAFDNGYSPQSVALDAPFAWGDWRPQNSGNSYSGYITLAHGLQYSKNIIAARITKHFGPEEIKKYAERMGVRSPIDPVRSIALGTSDVTLLEMVAAYSTIANYGVYHGPSLEEERPENPDVPPHITLAIDRIETRDGVVIEDFDPPGREVLSPSTAYTVFDAMRAVVEGGTGARLRSYEGVAELDVAGKTGTTQENADGWFIAMTPQLVVGSWTGFDDRRITYPSTSIGQGGRTGLRNVGAFLQRLQDGPESIRLDPEVEFEKPADYEPPSRRGTIGGGSSYSGDARGRTRSRARSGNSQNRQDDNPARDLIDRFQQRDRNAAPAAPAPRPQTEGGGTGGRIGW